MTSDQQKYRLRFFIDYGGIAYLWAADDYTYDRFGEGAVQNRVPMSDGLRKRGEELCAWFQTSLNWDYPPDPGLWRQEECDRFKVAVRAFFEDLKTELGENYDLIYEQYEPDEDPDLDRYLADPDFRRKPKRNQDK